eukprot:1157345-Pelagomonas_calceolata.AAC.12
MQVCTDQPKLCSCCLEIRVWITQKEKPSPTLPAAHQCGGSGARPACRSPQAALHALQPQNSRPCFRVATGAEVHLEQVQRAAGLGAGVLHLSGGLGTRARGSV